MTDRAWKAQERRVFKRLGVDRQPSNGKRNLDGRRDGVPFGYEAKYRQDVPAWFTYAMQQAVAGCTDGQTPVVVLTHHKGRGVPSEDYVILRLRDWIAWHGPQLPHCSGCAEPDAFDGANGVTHQMGTQEHP